jgi:hypothetical protein
VESKLQPNSSTSTLTRQSTIPKYWHPDLPDKTTVGFPNILAECYRNAVFQMILHMPIFYNWLAWYKKHHAPQGHGCRLAIGFTECHVCRLADIAQAYWAGNSRSWLETFDILTQSILLGWKPTGAGTEQDPAEYFDVLYKEIKASTKPMMYVLLYMSLTQKTDFRLQERGLGRYV